MTFVSKYFTMKFSLVSIFLITYVTSLSQDFSYQRLSENYDRNEFDITSTIPYKGGLLSVVMDSKNNFNAKYDISVCLISHDRKIQKSIKIGFKAEPFLRLIGLYQINDKPVIFYTNYASYKKVLHIKAILLNPETLQVEMSKEIKEMPLAEDDMSLIITDNSDAIWRSPIRIKISQDSSKYLLIYAPEMSNITGKKNITEAYFAVLDEEANFIYDKIETYPHSKFSLVFNDFLLTHNGKIFSLFSVFENRFTTENCRSYLRITETKGGKYREINLDKSVEVIRDANFLFRNKNDNNIEIIGTFSEESNDKDFSGVYRLQIDAQTETLKTLVRKNISDVLYLTEIYPEYGAEGAPPTKGYKYPLYARIHKIYSGYRNNGSIDYSLEYGYRGLERKVLTSGTYFSFYFLSIINFSFTGDNVISTVVEKKQITENNDAMNACGVKTIPFGNKLIYLYSDMPGNTDPEKKPKPFEPLKKNDCSLVAVIIDENGKTSKQEITSAFGKKQYPEPINAAFLNNKTLVLRIANPNTRYKETDIAFLTIE